MSHQTFLSCISGFVQNVRAKSQDITGINPCQLGLFSGFAQPDVIDKAAVAAAGVDQEKLVLFKYDNCVLPGQDFAVKKGIV